MDDFFHRQLRTAHAVAAVVTEIAVTVAHRDRAAVVAGGSIDLELGKLRLPVGRAAVVSALAAVRPLLPARATETLPLPLNPEAGLLLRAGRWARKGPHNSSQNPGGLQNGCRSQQQTGFRIQRQRERLGGPRRQQRPNSRKRRHHCGPAGAGWPEDADGSRCQPGRQAVAVCQVSDRCPRLRQLRLDHGAQWQLLSLSQLRQQHGLFVTVRGKSHP